MTTIDAIVTHPIHFVAMAPQFSFAAACTKLQVNEGRGRFHAYIVNHGYEPHQAYSLDIWRDWLEMFDAWDARNTQRDSLQ